MILKSFEFQCDFDFDFQIPTSKMIWILILNHLYLCDLILKSSIYDDFAHLCIMYIRVYALYAYILCLYYERNQIIMCK